MAVCESSTPDLEPVQDTASCMSCHELKGVLKYCVTCRKDCCETCIANSHGNHSSLPIEHQIVRNIKLFSTDTCTTHRDEKWSMYCVTCKTPCCFTCIDESHDAHSLSTIRSITKQAESLYAKLVDDLPQAKTKYSCMQKEYDDYVQSNDVTTSGIKKRFERLRLTIDEMEASMLHPLEKEVEEVRKMHADHGQPIQEAECLVELYKSAKDEERTLNSVILFSNYPSFESLDSEKESYPESVSFETTQMDIPETDDMIGAVVRSSGRYVSHDVGFHKTPFLDVISLTPVDRLVINGTVLHMTDGTIWNISKPEHNYDNIFKKWSWNVKFSFFDNLKQKYGFTITDGSFREGTDVSIIPPSDLVFTDSNNRKVWRVSTLGTKSLVMSTSPVIPTAVCFTSDGKLVLGLHSSNKRMMRIYALNYLKSHGEIKDDEHGNPLFSSQIKSITENSNGNLIVEDSFQLLCVTKQGHLKWTIEDVFDLFCCDKYCHIVGAISDEIRIYDYNGKYVKTLLTKFDFISRPTSLSIDNDGLLWIGQGNSAKFLKYYK